MKIPLEKLDEPFYEGSVQRLFAVPRDVSPGDASPGDASPGDASVMVTQTTSRGSVFDVGALFEIEGNDVNRALFRHVLYSRLGDPAAWQRVRESIEAAPEVDPAFRGELLGELLESCCERGARTHHEGMIDGESGEVVREGVPQHPSAFNVVRRYHILKPERAAFFGTHLFDYARFHHEDGFVIPLEFLVRFGITSASSIFRKYAAMDEAGRRRFERELGAEKPLRAWRYLERPIVDFTTKFEPEDRMVSRQEALATSGLDGDRFVESGKLAMLGAWAVRRLVEEIGLQLWDLKWEFARDGDELVFVDTMDTDSCRVTMFLHHGGEQFAIHYNKQAMRDYFSLLHRDWIAAIDEAKEAGRREGVPFTERLEAGQETGRYPATPSVDPRFLEIQERKMSAIRDFLLGREEATAVKASLEAAGRDEIAFYRDREALGEFRQINGIS